MKRWMAAGLCVLLSACASGPAAGGPPSETLPDDGIVRPEGKAPVEMRIGQVLEIALTANASTGYQWEFTEDGAPVLSRTTGPATPPPMDTQPPMPGASSIARWWFRADKAGKTTVRMVYRRPWETVPPVEVVEYEVDVR
ncbi:Predicted secreted protein [Pseudoxanthomonas sp. CF385]|uniref:protease inhibitor I42 family protein n=1 Tax=Pseudoxanthomonas sp. CF385 TaxID=1881042 RepID=UPI0008925A31|nr:protease inhibitor I42 family protein [Pseudoxanthomonas sp. CF385]SDQ21661.1 Predicted secreted protein [Pseudoxanthomonas sp. CF385]